MVRKPRLVDLFCKAGGATKGYQRAGFYVVGVDIEPQPNYCGDEFWQADALDCDKNWLLSFDAIHSSPPCQVYSKGAGKAGTRAQHRDLIAPTRDLLVRTGLPYVIENIAEARRHLLSPIMLCGETFGLGVFRHRYFESNARLPLVLHQQHSGRIGDGRFVTVTGHAGGSSRRDGWKNGAVADWKYAMDIHWMTGDELAQALPPVYTTWIGTQLLAALERAA